MSDLFDFNPRPLNFAVVGNPVEHSKSPVIHSLFAQQCGIDLDYQRMHVDLGGFEQAVSHFQAHDGAGLNVTAPFKVDAWQLCNRPTNTLSDRADLAQSVNTLHFRADGTIFGDNTDGIGMVRDIENNIGHPLKNKRILIVGAGGAVRGVLGPVLAKAPQSVTIANRTSQKAYALADQFTGNVIPTSLSKTDTEGYDFIINGTTSSLQDELPGIREDCITSDTVVYDMVYADQPTVFMKWALANGAENAFNGVGMLVEQAAESFYIWHQARPDSRAVIDALLKR